MNEADVFGKLSRIFETHGFNNDDAGELDDILEELNPADNLPQSPSNYYGSGKKSKKL